MSNRTGNMTDKSKFIQIASSRFGIFALDENGVVWEYKRYNEKGQWEPLSENRWWKNNV